MKAASPALVALINTGVFDAFECFTFSLIGGGQLLLTTAPFKITAGGITWPANGPIVLDGNDGSGSRGHWKVGLDVDEWTITVAPRSRHPVTGALWPDKIGDAPFLQALRAGILDAAPVTIQRAFFVPSVLVQPLPQAGVTPVGFLTIFRGLVSDVDLTTGQATIKAQDLRQLLSIQMPRNVYQAGCRHTLFDSGCKLVAATFKKAGAVTAAASRTVFSANPAAPAGSATYALGRVTMTSGKNVGLARTIVDWDGAQAFRVAPPFPFALAIGDTGDFLPGCDKTMTTCTAFANLVNFGGNPFIPPPTTSGL